MAYHGYIGLLKQRLRELPHPPVMLEVGVDRGVSFLSLVVFLARTRPEFVAVGVDVLVQEATQLLLSNIDLQPKQQAYLIEGNSLSILPKLVDQKMKFDLVLLDGDHNYHTVSNELQHLEHLVHDHSIVVIDDYRGRWSDRDLWYSERSGYETVHNASKRVDTEKHGVKPAVDEWLAAHPEWHSQAPIPGEPIMLSRQP